METINRYIDESLAGIANGKLMSDFRKKILSELTERANELTHRGLRDNKVIYDLIISEHPDLRKEYSDYSEGIKRKKREKNARKKKILFSVLYVLIIVLAYLAISFISKAWDKTWLIILGGITAIITFFIVTSFRKLLSRGRTGNFAARVLTAADIMLLSVFVFLLCAVVFSVPRSWLIILGGVAVMLAADGVIAYVTKQKLAIINILLYVPGIAAMLYVIGGIAGFIPWHPGWLIMPAAVIIDVIIIICAVAANSKYTYEEEEE